MRPKILIIRGGAIGDFVLTLPAIKLLRENFPAASLEILGYPHILSLAHGRYYADEIRSIEYSALAGFFVPGSELAPELVQYFAGFQQVISYLYDPDFFFETNLRRCGVKNFLSVPPVLKGSEHAAFQLARPLEQLALYLDTPQAQLFPSEYDLQLAAQFLGQISNPMVAIHPGSGSSRKNWPLERWRLLAEWILHQPMRPSLLLVGGEAENNQIEELRSQLLSHVGSHLGASVRLACNLPLPHLAAILQKATLFLGHDSGISHIAAALGTPSILVFGPTEPEVWAPVGSHVQVLLSKNKDPLGIETETMKEAIVSKLPEAGWIF